MAIVNAEPGRANQWYSTHSRFESVYPAEGIHLEKVRASYPHREGVHLSTGTVGRLTIYFDPVEAALKVGDIARDVVTEKYILGMRILDARLRTCLAGHHEQQLQEQTAWPNFRIISAGWPLGVQPRPCLPWPRTYRRSSINRPSLPARMSNEPFRPADHSTRRLSFHLLMNSPGVMRLPSAVGP
jgi:hypothetical protein